LTLKPEKHFENKGQYRTIIVECRHKPIGLMASDHYTTLLKRCLGTFTAVAQSNIRCKR